MTCKDCIHYEVCYDNDIDLEFGNVAEKECSAFKNKADVQEVKRGNWKQLYDKAPRYVCTACNHLFNNRSFKFCPNCGAKMDWSVDLMFQKRR